MIRGASALVPGAMYKCSCSRLGLIQCMWRRLGKTVQVMALIAYLMERKDNYGPHLIIVPNAVMVNWKSELTQWLPTVRCVYYVGHKVRDHLPASVRTPVYTPPAHGAPLATFVMPWTFKPQRTH